MSEEKVEVESGQNNEEEKSNVVGNEGLYGLTKRSAEYSSENYKLELLNLSGKPKFHVIKQLFERQFKITPHKIRLGHKKAFVAFRTEQERDEALAKLNNQEWRGRTLMAQVASPRDDLLAKKRKLDPEEREDNGTVGENETVTDNDINDQVCPLWAKSYDDQIKYKETLIRSILNMSKQVLKMNPNLQSNAPKLYEWVKTNEKICCQFDGVVRSPVLVAYRNKCEFNIGRDGSVGFKLGRYKSGSERVCRPPNNCPILTKLMFDIIDSFHLYLRESSRLRGFDLVTHEGNYRQITIRCNSNDEYLVIVDLHPQSLSKEELDSEIQRVVDHLKSIKQVVSIYFNISEKCQFAGSNQSLKLASGQSCLYEHLSVDPDDPLKFRIGPASFFQVNSRAAELLYRSIVEVAQLDSTSMVLDVGCGTGTIGLSLARKVNHVIGIEIVPSAIEDAKINAQTNGIMNVTFFAGKAEDLIGESISILRNKLEYQKIKGEIVAIVDPPRVGFNSSFIKTLRASNIKKIVYIACDPKANTNLLSLCRPKSKAYQGDPFVPTRAKAFDLFPHTKCCELLLVYERLSTVA